MPQGLATALQDRYRLDRELGQGGMATVYLAHDLKHDRDVALKVLRPELAAVLGRERFLAEIHLTAKLDHPHILTLIDSGESDGFLWYVVPFIRGESLRQKLVREKQLGVDEALAIAKQIAGALDYAHQHGVIHRDLKPENILLHEGEAMLVDFGIALAVKEAGGNRLTETGLSLGTPQYMSPEQATGDRQLDARSDVYSLGAVLYEMLAGEPPVTGPTVQAVIAKLMVERPTSLRVVRQTVSVGIESAVAKALAKVPADRYSSAGAFAAALSASGKARLTPAWRTRLAGLAAAAALMALGGLGWSLLHRAPLRSDVPLDRVQLTSTGNAGTPALSPDGTRVAYQTRECDAAGHCTATVVIQDVAGGGQLTVLRRVPFISGFMWTNDGRYLLFASWSGRRAGAHIVSTLGGEPRFLGCCGSTVGAGDTVIVAAQPDRPGPGILRFITAGDGTTRDSLLVPRSQVGDLWVRSSRDGRRLAVILGQAGGTVVRVTSRQGRVTDSLGPLSYEWIFTGITPQGDALLVGLPHLSDWGSIDLVRYRIDKGGRLARKPDTLLAQVSSAQWIDLSLPGGSLAYAGGSARYSVWALQRPAVTSMQLGGRRLLASTTRLVARLSADGERIGLSRLTVRNGRQMAGFALIPFDSGPEVTGAVPSEDLLVGRWSREGSRGVLARRTADSLVTFQEGDSAGGPLRTIGVLPERLFTDFYPLHGGGVAVLAPGGRRISRVGVPDRADTTFAVPDSLPLLQELGAAPDRLELLGAGFDYAAGELRLLRISLADGTLSRVASLRAPISDVLLWLPDGSFLASVRETGQNSVWYRIGSSGDTTRLGEPPHLPAAYSLSSDGLRAVAVAEEWQTDIFLIRDFGKVLER